MPPLKDTIRQLPAGYEHIPPQVFTAPLTTPAQPPTFPQAPNQFLRCPLPPTAITPDSLRQFYRTGEIPQARVMTPTILANASGGGGTTTTTVATTSSSSSSSGGSSTSPTSQQTSLNTPSMNPGNQYMTTLTMAKSFVLLNISVNAAVRVELYSTHAAQLADLSRAASVGVANNPPPAEIMNACVCDLYLDTIDKFAWIPSWTITGINGDNPQSSSIYVTITNIDVATNFYTVTFTFVPLES